MLPLKWACWSIVLVVSVAAMGSQAGRVFSIPDSVLLFGSYNELHIVTPGGDQLLRPPVDLKYNGGYFAYPGISPHGDTVAWGFATKVEEDRPDHRVRFALGLYSLTARKWRTYGDYDDIGSAAYSPTGSKVVFVARTQGRGREELWILDVGTETVSKAAVPRVGLGIKSGMGWSPDETRLVVEAQQGGVDYYPEMAHGKANPVIGVLDLKSGAVQVFGEGFDPAWSPTGEWIAYSDLSGKQCLVMHPDGTGLKTVTKLKDSWFAARYLSGTAPVWSPDGKQLLLNVVKNDGPAIDVVLLDLPSGRTTTKSQSGSSAFGWAPYHR